VLVLLRFEASPDDEDFLAAGRQALALLAARPGFRAGQLARAYEQPGLFCLVTEWESVGAYRRAIGSYEVKAGATMFLSRALPEPSAYEPLDTIAA
jgi:heme-degrading monooxygenase HmoA